MNSTFTRSALNKIVVPSAKIGSFFPSPRCLVYILPLSVFAPHSLIPLLYIYVIQIPTHRTLPVLPPPHPQVSSPFSSAIGPGASHPGIGQIFTDSRPPRSPPPAPLKQSDHASRSLERDLAEGNAQSFKLTTSTAHEKQQGAHQDQGAHQGQGAHEGHGAPDHGQGHTQGGAQAQAAWNNRSGDGESGRIASVLSGGGGGDSIDGSSRQQHPGGFSKGSEIGDGGREVPFIEATGDRGGGGGSGVGPDGRLPTRGADMLPREIYQKLSEHVVGQVRMNLISGTFQ